MGNWEICKLMDLEELEVRAQGMLEAAEKTDCPYAKEVYYQEAASAEREAEKIRRLLGIVREA